MKNVLVLLGPTASGKSLLAKHLAQHFGGTIINSDSMQVYKNFPVLSAHPHQKDFKQLPHKLYGIFDLEKDERCTTATWVDQAITEINKAHKQNSLPILVGGTGLYIKALMEGLAAIPEIPATLRTSLQEDLLNPEKRNTLYALLQEKDPLTAKRVPIEDTQRLSRALEVLLHTGKSLSSWQAQVKKPQHDFSFQILALYPEKDPLYHRINQRTLSMIEEGALEEVKRFITTHPEPPQAPLIGYGEIAAHLQGSLPLHDVIAKIQQKTRNYAKRQLTWIRHQLPPHMLWKDLYTEDNWEDFKKDLNAFLPHAFGSPTS